MMDVTQQARRTLFIALQHPRVLRALQRRSVVKVLSTLVDLPVAVGSLSLRLRARIRQVPTVRAHSMPAAAHDEPPGDPAGPSN